MLVSLMWRFYKTLMKLIAGLVNLLGCLPSLNLTKASAAVAVNLHNIGFGFLPDSLLNDLLS